MPVLLGMCSERREAPTGPAQSRYARRRLSGANTAQPLAKGTRLLIGTTKRGLILPQLRRVRGKRAPAPRFWPSRHSFAMSAKPPLAAEEWTFKIRR
jgi:hypothetical protein